MKLIPEHNCFNVLLLLCALVLSCPHGAAADQGSEGGGELPRLELSFSREQCYPRQQVPVTVVLLAGSEEALRNIQYPRLRGNAFTITEFVPQRQHTITRDSQELIAYEFSARLTPLGSGMLTVGPAELDCELMVASVGSAAFLGGSEPRPLSLHSNTASLEVLPLPLDGRPSNFSGAIGHFSIVRQAVPREISAGDPVTVTTTIAGVGNIDTFSCPSIEMPGTTSRPPLTRRQPERLTCEQVLIVASTAPLVIPSAVISYFDPRSGRYQTIHSKAITLKNNVLSPVHSAAAAASSASKPPQPLPSVPVLRSWFPLDIVLLTLAAVLLTIWLHRRRAPAATDATDMLCEYLHQAEQALADNDFHGFYDNAFRVVQVAVAVHGDMPCTGICSVSSPLPPPLSALLQECDAIRYGLAPCSLQQMQEAFKNLKLVVADIYHQYSKTVA